MLRLLLLGVVFWALTLAFPSITISGFWTIAGVIVLFSVFNLIYQLTLGIILLPFRIITFDFVSWVANTLIVYILANIFDNFTIAEGSFWWVLLFTGIYTLIRGIFSPSSNSNSNAR